MRIELNGRRALVTGSSSGIGLAVATALAGAGATVLINGRDPHRVERAVDGIRKEHPQAELESVVADATTAGGAALIQSRAGELDILVANAAAFQVMPFIAISDADWQHMFDANVVAPARLARLFVPAMVERGWGRVVFIGSESARHIPVEMIHYGASKTALLALSRGLAETYPACGVTINAVLPGPTRTGAEESFIAGLAAQRRVSIEQARTDFIATDRPTSLLRRFIEPTEVAAMVTYVCSPLASATTGAALSVDGGVVRAVP